MAKADRCVVRNQAYRRGEFGIRERHNERKNENYGNGDIEPERSHLNVHFKECCGTYEQAFDQMVKDCIISLRGLGKAPKVFDELVFDVNTAYFDNHGGYEYAKGFFSEAYRMATKEVGGEQYILSAVMHADERNKAESERLGRDVYHYHLHVVYVPVVEKKVYFRKNNKNPKLAGKLKEVVMQVSHSKKWPRQQQLDENGEIVRNAKGKAVLLNSYSLLQDRFFEHMRMAGYTDFERGERGSTAQHLDTLEYKTQQEKKRAAELGQQSNVLDRQLAVKQEHLSELDDKITATKQAAVTFGEIDGMAKRKLLGKVELTAEDWDKVSRLAKMGVSSVVAIDDIRRQLAGANKSAEIYKNRWETISEDTQEYRWVRKLAPEQTQAALEMVARQEKETRKNARKPKRKEAEIQR